MAKSISIGQFLGDICKSSCSPPSGGPYLLDDLQSTFQRRWSPGMVRSQRREGLRQGSHNHSEQARSREAVAVGPRLWHKEWL